MEDVTPYILAELVADLGGVVELDYKKLHKNLIEGKYKNISIDIVEDKVRIEVYEDED